MERFGVRHTAVPRSQTLSAREYGHGALVLDAPGTYVQPAPDHLIIGNHLGIVHYTLVAICFPIGGLGLWLL